MYAFTRFPIARDTFLLLPLKIWRRTALVKVAVLGPLPVALEDGLAMFVEYAVTD